MSLVIDERQPVDWLTNDVLPKLTKELQVHTQEFNDESEDSDFDFEPAADANSHGAQTSVEKRRAQNEIFRIYAEKLTAEETEKEVRKTSNNANERDEELSIREILAKQESSVRITNPRDYQTELFERAKTENIIAVLDTGMGKTHIATLLLRHTLDIELENRAKGEPPKMAFFLVNSVNLVYQQSNVLQCGLDQKVEPLCGFSTKLWKKSKWDEVIEKAMVVVCTAEILVQCMMHSFINMAKVNLLIFDEAHHAKANHPFARLMRDYYTHEPGTSPRIFGMTASPVDGNDRHMTIRDAAGNLEEMLHCKLATISEEMLASNNMNKPEEKIVIYPRLTDEFETSFHKEIKNRYGGVAAFKKFFTSAKKISSEIGRWAADAYWTFALTEDQNRKIQKIKELRHDESKDCAYLEILGKQIARLREAAEFVGQYDLGSPSINGQDLSSKVLVLYKHLRGYYERSDESRCIVFVRERQTARLLQLLFSHIGGPNLRSGAIVGANAAGKDFTAGGNNSLRYHIMTVAKFRRGELNCIFATSVAEEGLDIPQCNLVIRFDLYRTMIQYVQSRGRARHRNSRYLHMIEKDNMEHRNTLINASQDELAVKAYCRSLPEDRLLYDVDKDIHRLVSGKAEQYPSYTDPDSGAKLTLDASLAVLNHFVASLPSSNQEPCSAPNYVIRSDFSLGRNQKGFQCEVILPDRAPIVSVLGKVQAKKAIAKCSAAFEMCIELRKRGFLNEHLLPTYTKQLPAMRNALLALKTKDKGKYTMLVKPTFWKRPFDTVSDHLHLTIVDIDGGLERQHQPLGVLTRAAFPQMPTFPIFLSDGRRSNVVSVPLTIALSLSEKELKLITAFTLQIYEQLYNKIYEPDTEKMSYWVVPIRRMSFEPSSTDPKDVIDMNQVYKVCDQPWDRWVPATENRTLENKFIVDAMDGGRRFYSKHVMSHLKPQDPVPNQDSLQKKKIPSILEYSDCRWKRTRDISEWDQSQPVVKVDKVPLRRNLLAPPEEKEAQILNDIEAYVCPEPLLISNFAVPFVVMCYTLPPIIHRYEGYLLALEASSLLGLKLSPGLALEALTKDTETIDDQGEDKIIFTSGMGPNYERLEFLGDCFLKMATSIATFVLQPDENEFEFHVRRMVMLCNKNLFNTATSLNIPPKPLKLYEYIRTEGFSRRDWYPEGLTMKQGKGKGRASWTKKHNLGFKSIADVCEAFIGAAFMEYNKNGNWNPKDWDQAVKAVTLFVNSEDHTMRKFSDYYEAYVKPTYQTARVAATQKELAKQIEETHSYHFKYPRLLRSAFVHPSQPFMWEYVPNYQRLEFLGDALLDMVFIMHLFYKYPEKDPHWLTEHKTPMVSNKFLAAVCVKLDFHHHIRHNSSVLNGQIQNYVSELGEAERETDGAVDYWTNVSEPPKCLADVVEAYVAAIFVDSEFNFTVVQDFFDQHLKPYFEDMTVPSYEAFATNHPINRFNKLLDIDLGCHEWRVAVNEIETVLPSNKKKVVAMIMIHDKILFHYVGTSSKYARIKVCKAAVEDLEGLPPYEFRNRFSCNCSQKQE